MAGNAEEGVQWLEGETSGRILSSGERPLLQGKGEARQFPLPISKMTLPARGFQSGSRKHQAPRTAPLYTCLPRGMQPTVRRCCKRSTAGGAAVEETWSLLWAARGIIGFSSWWGRGAVTGNGPGGQIS